LILQNGGLIVFGSVPISIQTPLSRESWEIGPILLNQGRTVSFVLAVAFALALYLFLSRVPLGKALRAAADNPIAAAYVGVDVDRSHRLAFGLGVGITAVAGGLIASSQSFQPYVGSTSWWSCSPRRPRRARQHPRRVWGGLTIGLCSRCRRSSCPTSCRTRDLRRLPADHLLLARGMFGRTWERA